MKETAILWVRQSLKILWAILARGAGSIIKFLMNILLGRVLGAEGVGFFFLFLSWSNVLGIVAGLGLPTYTLRTVAVLEGEENKHRESQQYLSAALRMGLQAGGLMAILPFVFSSVLAKWLLTSSDYGYIIRAAAVAGLGTVILTIFTEALTGRGQIITAMQLESAVIPFVMIVFLALALLLKISISARITIIAYLVGIFLTILLARWFWLHRGHPLLLDHSEKTNPIHLRYQDLAAFWGGGVVNVIANNIAFLALPFFAGPADIGRFGIAQRMATMSITILDALSNIFMPAFARRYAHRDAAGLRHDLLMSQVYSMLAYLPFVAIFIFFAKPILGVVGEDFIAAQRFLMILMLGQLFNSATGLPGQLLNMIHRQDLAFYMNIAHLIVAAVLTYKLGSDYGALGVVIAVSISVVFKNLIFYIVARIHIHNSSKEWQPS